MTLPLNMLTIATNSKSQAILSFDPQTCSSIPKTLISLHTKAIRIENQVSRYTNALRGKAGCPRMTGGHRDRHRLRNFVVSHPPMLRQTTQRIQETSTMSYSNDVSPYHAASADALNLALFQSLTGNTLEKRVVHFCLSGSRAFIILIVGTF
ncbi:hypothetical protein CPB83DRAFT_121942 [Crepidotus variabilis]|uniref:Uncharacterized protein n=1 Tax=Crepidotus variabilis TaxID=179855 RepID=A0A9P6JT16_9AGAR|nr:hypothetical protein CPB83DRAFT_121942 [Crepidotus variabilis]